MKDICDVNNYRAIAIYSTISKVFESVILNAITTAAEGDENLAYLQAQACR